MNSVKNLMSTLGGAAKDVFNIVKDGLSQLSFLKPLAFIMGGVVLFAGLLEMFGAKLSSTFWKQLLIFAAIIGVMVSVGQLISRQRTASTITSSDVTPQTNLTSPIPNDPNNVFSYPDPTHPGQMQNPATGVVMPETVGGMPVDGSESAIGQKGTYGFQVAPSAPGRATALTVVSPEPPPSNSAAEMRLKDGAIYNFLKQVPPANH